MHRSESHFLQSLGQGVQTVLLRKNPSLQVQDGALALGSKQLKHESGVLQALQSELQREHE